ncbi:glycosyltransferase family 2 protein [Mycobacterium paraffinicum]|uniref:Glycosyltransferase 2-like domain-containing protein n=1 Tax=Mycobacterium paraffinicum TaxID=53378 RepID=A0ABP8RCY4_9MYCO|nr:glycosyltransferase family 2 protein [Mycobacterium paraffinicum]MCV7313718.1 glycosyltransferase family 2 protein [Mycobacterium paraffinicum]
MIEALGIAMVKNEADVIEAFVRHNLNFMDALAIVDNDSVDDTREILVRLQREGLPVILFDDPIVGHFQAEIVTAVYRKVVPKFKPRFVFLLDADEFIVTPSRDALYTQLRAMRPGTQAQYCWRTYIPAPTGPEGDASDPLRSITHRKAEEGAWWKPIIVTKPKIDMKLRIKQGNHGATYLGRSLRKVKLTDVTIAHFPVRSVDQFTSKILVGWIANLERNRYRLDFAHAIHWKVVYERIIRGPAFTREDLTHEALKYADFSGTELTWPSDVVRDPVTPGYGRLTAQPAISCTPLQKVVRSIDRIFNPEADASGLASDLQFLENSRRSMGAWRRLKRPFGGAGSKTALYVDLPPFRYLAERYCPTSVLAIGGGSEAYLKYFAAHGAERATSVDGCEPGDLAETFDLVMCVQPPQHVPAESESALVGNMLRHARDRIVLSGAPGRSGAGHFSGSPMSHWLDLFASAGWRPCLFDSLTLQSLSTFPVFRSSLVVLTREIGDAGIARERLMELEPESTKRNKQRPAVIAHSFVGEEAKLLAHRDSRAVAKANAYLRVVISRVLE